jgi:hypothetical protein
VQAVSSAKAAQRCCRKSCPVDHVERSHQTEKFKKIDLVVNLSKKTLEITLNSAIYVDCIFKRNVQEEFTGADIRLFAVRSSLTDIPTDCRFYHCHTLL